MTPRKERDPLCTGKEAAKEANIVISPGARQVAPFPSDPKKECDPLCTGQEAAKAANIVMSPAAKQVALIWNPGAIGNQIYIEFHYVSNLAKSETLPIPSCPRNQYPIRAYPSLR